MDATQLAELASSYGLGVGTMLYFLWEKTKLLAEARDEIKRLNAELLEEAKK